MAKVIKLSDHKVKKEREIIERIIAHSKSLKW